jgi:hypothetical protein
LYGVSVYWDQYQGFKTPAFWLNVLFQKVAPPQPPYRLMTPRPPVQSQA